MANKSINIPVANVTTFKGERLQTGSISLRDKTAGSDFHEKLKTRKLWDKSEINGAYLGIHGSFQYCYPTGKSAKKIQQCGQETGSDMRGLVITQIRKQR